MSRDEPCTNLNFRVEFEGLPLDGFCHVSGLESMVDVVEGKKRKPRKAGEEHCKNLTLRRAINGRRELWNWYQATLEGERTCRDGSIVILNDEREECLRIHIRQAWPCRWKLSALDSLQPEVLSEEIELVIESFRIH